METVSQGGHSATYSYDPNSIAKKIYIVADENGQTRYYDASSKCWKKIGLDLVENALAADAKGLEQFIAAQNGPSLREQILKDAFLSGDPSIGDWLLYQFFDKLNGAGTLDLASAYYHHDIFSQQSLSDEAATLYALWGGVQLGAASTELVDLGALAKGLFRPSSSARFYDADYIVDLSGYAVAPRTTPHPYAGVREASEYLQAQGVPRHLRKDVLESFGVRTINVRGAGDADLACATLTISTPSLKGGISSRPFQPREVRWPSTRNGI